jgi:hypothetical protein
MGRVNEVLDRAITVIVLGIFLVPIALYALLLVTAFSFYLVSRVWPCEWPLHQTLEGFNPSCPDIDTAD